MQQYSLIKAVVIIFVGMAAFDLMSILVRILGQDFSIIQISMLRNVFGIIPAFILLTVGPGIGALKKLNSWKNWKIIFVRSIAVFMAQLAFYTSLTKIEFATAATLCFTSPFFITLFSIPLLGHHIGAIRVLALVVGFSGVVTIFQPFKDDFTFWMMLPVVAGLGYGLSSVLVKLVPDDVPSAAIQITQQFTTFVFGACLLITTQEFVPVGSIESLFYFALMGIFGGIGVLCLIMSYRLVEPSTISVFEYFGIPISFAMGWVFFDEAPFSRLFPGVLLLIGAGLLIIFRERTLGHLAQKNFR